jgi:hypothetical protein
MATPYRSKTDVWNVTVTLKANSPAFTNFVANITYADQFGTTETKNKLQLPYGFKIKDVVFSNAPTPDVVVIIDKNNGQRQWQSVPASQLVLQAGRPRLDPFGRDELGRKIVPAFNKFDIMSVIVRPLANVGASDVNVTFQLYVEYT